MAQGLPLDMVASICHQLSTLVEAVYTPMAGSALIIKGTGEAVLTKSGIQIITEAKCHHPLSKVIVKALVTFHNITGDCSKLFLFLLNEMMFLTKCRLKRSSDEYKYRINLISDATSLLAVIPCIFYQLRRMRQSLSEEDVIIKNILVSFFFTKFSSTITNYLSSLVSDFIKSIMSDLGDTGKRMNFLLENFDHLCSRFIGSTDKSVIIDGMVFSRVLSPLLAIDFKEISFVVLQCLSELESSNHILMFREEQALQDLFQFKTKLYDKIISHLKNYNVSVVFISSMADSLFLTLCERNGLTLIDCLPGDELNLLMSMANVSTIDVWQSINSRSIGKAKFIRSIVLGNKKYLNIFPYLHSFALKPCHLVLYAPLESLCKEYYFECLNSIKLIRNYFSNHFRSCDAQCICDQIPLEGRQDILGKYIATLWESQLASILEIPSLKSNVASGFLSTGILKVLLKNKKLSYLVAESHFDSRKDSLVGNEHCFLFTEPIFNKECLITSVLTLWIQLLSVSEIVYVKNKSQEIVK